MMKALMILLFLFFCAGGKAAALEIDTGDYGKNFKLVKVLKEKITKLHIYGKPELMEVWFIKNKGNKLCGFAVEYDEPIDLGKAKYLQTDKNSLPDCADELLNFIKRLNYFYALKELRALGAEINGEDVEIVDIDSSDFPAATAGEYLIRIVLSENEFEFFISDKNNPDDILFYAATIEEAARFLMENIPEIIRENYGVQEYYLVKNNGVIKKRR